MVVKLYGGRVRLSKLFCPQEQKPRSCRMSGSVAATPVDLPLTVTDRAQRSGPDRRWRSGLRGQRLPRGTSDNRYGALFFRSGPSAGSTIHTWRRRTGRTACEVRTVNRWGPVPRRSASR